MCRGPHHTLAVDAMEITGASRLQLAAVPGKAGCVNPRRTTATAAPRRTLPATIAALAQALALLQAWSKDPRANEGTAACLRFVATTLDDFIAGDVPSGPGALKLRVCAGHTTHNWRRELQRFGRTLLLYSGHAAESMLTRHLTLLVS